MGLDILDSKTGGWNRTRRRKPEVIGNMGYFLNNNKRVTAHPASSLNRHAAVCKGDVHNRAIHV